MVRPQKKGEEKQANPRERIENSGLLWSHSSRCEHKVEKCMETQSLAQVTPGFPFCYPMNCWGILTKERGVRSARAAYLRGCAKRRNSTVIHVIAGIQKLENAAASFWNSVFAGMTLRRCEAFSLAGVFFAQTLRETVYQKDLQQMKKLRLRVIGDPVLRRKAHRIDKVTPRTRETIDAMWEMMYESNGVGLAAPQVGLSQRIIVVDTREPGEKYALVNPEIIWTGDEMTPLSEGCLSVPGLEGEVIRPSEVRVTGLTPEGKRIEVSGKDLLAKVFQHEIDHLEGVLFIDRLSPNDLERLEPDLAKFETHAVV